MRASFAFVLVASSLVACASEAGSPAPEPEVEAPPPEEPAATAPKLVTVPCRFIVPRSVEGKTFHCADLSVPENRRVPNGKTIKLHVAVVKGKEGGVPTIELVGGPGGNSDSIVGGVAARRTALLRAYGRFLDAGDLVLFDQRGTGRSLPRLSCGMDERGPASCRADLEKQGIDVAAYDTVENADDVHDLVRALGAAKVDLHGISYGTRLGIEVLKRHPGDVRAAILDGVMPSDVPVLGNFEIAIDRILTTVFAACAADEKCTTTYPNLDATLTQVKAKLDATPFKATDPIYGTYTYDWRAFTSELVQRSYEEGAAARIPWWIHGLLAQTEAEWTAAQDKAMAEAEARYVEEEKADADNPLAAELSAAMRAMGQEDWAATDMAYGMYLSVTCNDYAQHESLAEARAALAKVRPELRDPAAVEDEFAMCEVWAKRPSDPGVRAAPTFGGPVLLIGGALDPATPSVWAEHVATTLPKGQLVTVPTGGHGLMDECGGSMKGAFLLDPTRSVDSACATERTIAFYYDGPKGLRSARANEFGPAIRPASTSMGRVADRVLAAMSAPLVGLPHVREIARHRR
ncbi:MAG: alpha/beta hydrolase [Labilithrix sp.]|nr:alpha/beta hydrolase [Labilithrix sp.]